MWLSGVSVRVEAGDRVDARHSPARVERYPDGYEFVSKELVHVHIGDLALFGPPAVVIEVLGRALRESYAACGGGNPDGSDDGPAGPAAAVVRVDGGGER